MAGHGSHFAEFQRALDWPARSWATRSFSAVAGGPFVPEPDFAEASTLGVVVLLDEGFDQLLERPAFIGVVQGSLVQPFKYGVEVAGGGDGVFLWRCLGLS